MSEAEYGVVLDVIKIAKKYGLEAEVMYTALQYMKASKGTVSIIEAADYGLDEWVK